jgi:hypothetical protein
MTFPTDGKHGHGQLGAHEYFVICNVLRKGGNSFFNVPI